MKKVRVCNNYEKIEGVSIYRGEKQIIDYYHVAKEHERHDAFSNVYTHNSYDL